MFKNLRLTIGRKIYGIICLCLAGFLGLTYLASTQLASALRSQRQLELKHVTELAVGVV